MQRNIPSAGNTKIDQVAVSNKTECMVKYEKHGEKKNTHTHTQKYDSRSINKFRLPNEI